MERFDWDRFTSNPQGLEVLQREQPVACTPVIAAVALTGLAIGYAAGYAECHHHGFVTQSMGLEVPAGMGVVSVGELLQFRTDVAGSR